MSASAAKPPTSGISNHPSPLTIIIIHSACLFLFLPFYTSKDKKTNSYGPTKFGLQADTWLMF